MSCNTSGQCTNETDVVPWDVPRAGTHVPLTYKSLCELDPLGEPNDDCRPQQLCEGMDGGDGDHGHDHHDLDHPHESDYRFYRGRRGGYLNYPYWARYPQINRRYRYPDYSGMQAAYPRYQMAAATSAPSFASTPLRADWVLPLLGFGALALFLIKRK